MNRISIPVKIHPSDHEALMELTPEERGDMLSDGLQEHLRKRTERDHERGRDKKWWQVWR
jgi:hypothetical protein